MSNISIKLLAPENANAIIVQQAKAVDAELIAITPNMARSPEESSRLQEAIKHWEKLRQEPFVASRYNSHKRFLSDIINHPDPENFQFAAIILKNSDVLAVLRGSLNSNTPWFGLGRLNRILPKLRCLSLPRTSILTDNSSEAIEEVLNYLTKLVKLRMVNMLQIDNLEISKELTANIIKDQGLSTSMVKTKQIRWIRQLLDPETKQPINQNSAKTRSSWRRKHRQLEKEFDGDLEFTQINSIDQIDEFVSKASDIVNRTYQSALGIGIEDTDEDRQFITDMFNDGLLRGYLVSGKGEAISYVAGDVENGRFDLWATAFLPEYTKLSPGLVLLNHVIAELSNEGVEILDFGHGEAVYKERFGSLKIDEIDLRIYSPGLGNTFVYKADAFSIWLKNQLKELIVKFKLKDFGRKWLRKSQLRQNSSH